MHKKIRIYSFDELNFPVELIEPSVLEIIDSLKDNGFLAFLVGGAVRDILFNYAVRDFDIITNASLGEAAAIFDKSVIVGKRYPVLHIRKHDKIFELSSFNSNKINTPYIDDYEIFLRQFCIGVRTKKCIDYIIHDAYKRDYTFNALYVDMHRKELIDVVDGVSDINSLNIATIGGNIEGARNDPMRVLRAIRFIAKYNLHLNNYKKNLILHSKYFLQQIIPEKIMHEFRKIIFSGFSSKIIATYYQFKVVDVFFCNINYEDDLEKQHVIQVFQNIDRRIEKNMSISLSFCLACVFFVTNSVKFNNVKLLDAKTIADDIVTEQLKKISCTPNTTTVIKELLVYTVMMQKPSLSFIAFIRNRNITLFVNFLFFKRSLSAHYIEDSALEFWRKHKYGSYTYAVLMDDYYKFYKNNKA